MKLQDDKSTKFELAPYFSSGLQNDSLFLGFGSIQKEIKEKNKFSLYLNLAALLKEPQYLINAKEKLMVKGFENHEIQEAIEMFHSSHFLMPAKTYDRAGRYSRHALFYNMSGGHPAHVQKRLAASRVAILGCGGIGNLISVNLATAGVGELVLFDQDEIEISNLTRQVLFTEQDVGRSKTEVLKTALEKRASNVKIRQVRQLVNSLEDLESLKDMDLIVVSADGKQAVSKVNEFCVKHKIAFINVGYIQDIAVWGPFYIPKETGCYHCQNIVAAPTSSNPELAELLKKINLNYQAPSIGPVNMLAASSASLDILKYLGRFGEVQSKNKRLGVWTHDLKITHQDCHINPECSYCGSNS